MIPKTVWFLLAHEVIWEGSSIPFEEVDEHRHDDRSVVYEQVRMALLSTMAKSLAAKAFTLSAPTVQNARRLTESNRIKLQP